MRILIEHNAVCNIKVKITYIYNSQEHKNILLLLLYKISTREINRTYICCILHYIICSHVKQ